MVFRRKGSTRLYFQARTETGWVQLPTGTSNRVLAQKIAAMWERLASDERAWDVLNRVLASEIKVTRLWDLWKDTKESLPEVRRRLTDPDLERYIAMWERVYAQQRPKNLQKAVHRLRYLIPAGQPLLRSQVTTAWLTERLYAYVGKPNTLRGVHSAWSVFFQYLTDVHGLFVVNPMAAVRRPPQAGKGPQFLELDQVLRVVTNQYMPELQAFYAIAYGTGIETGVTLGLTRADFWEASREIRAAGTKAHNRDRVARVAPWAWPIVWGYAQHLPATARLFPESWRDDQVSTWHGATLKRLELPHLPLHNARHHWAVSQLRAGVPLEIVRRQLGHSTPVLTLRTYGQFIPSGEDRERWERVVQEDQERRQPKRPAPEDSDR